MFEILIADDHEMVRSGLRQLLESEPEWRVCVEAADGLRAVQLAAQLRPALAVLDVKMPGLDGLEAARQIRRESPLTEVLIFTACDDIDLAEQGRAAGACGFMPKTSTGCEIVGAVRAIARRSPQVYGNVTALPVNAVRAPRPHSGSRLTQRERQIAQLLAEGKSNWSVATILGISVKTVETHRSNIMRKLDLESIVELVHYAVRNQLVRP